MNMIFRVKINTEIKLKSVKYLNKLKLILEVNNWDNSNFSELSR